MKRFLSSLSFFAFILIFSVSNLYAEKPYVLIISMDGFRWDYLDRGITPHILKMADGGVRAIGFEPAFPSKTFPNHYSIVTGLFPQNHGLVNNRFFNPSTGERYKVGDTVSVRDDKWYRGETLWETATRQGVKSASFFWPGSETHLAYKHPTYFKHYDGTVTHEQRIQGIIDWLQLPESQRPHLLFLYFSDTDDFGHRFGPDAPELNQAVKRLDEKLGLLRQKLAAIDMLDKVNIILLSDHGMTKLYPDRVINLTQMVDMTALQFAGYGPLVQFFTKNRAEQIQLIKTLQSKGKGFSVYTKETIPTYYHYSANSFIGDVILVAEPGYSFVTSQRELEFKKKHNPKGDHGYDNRVLDMQGIFIANGPAFKTNYKTVTLLNVDVYPLVCKILGIIPNQMIDGRLERIEQVLK